MTTEDAEEHLDAQFAAFDAPAEFRDVLRTEHRREHFPIHEDNEATVAAFLALQTQWRIIAGFGAVVYQGIDYPSVPAVLDALSVPPDGRADVFQGLRIMEASALPILNARDDE